MPLTKTQSEIWQAMNIGPQWIERTEDDASAQIAQDASDGKTILPKNSSLASVGSVSINPAATGPRRGAVLLNACSEGATPQDKNLADNSELQARAEKASWEELSELVSRCRACPMATTRKHCVFADGKPGCPIAIVGEAPGRDEDIEGIPFVGKSGQLLTRILESLEWKRGVDVAIVNVLKCRPPDNRDPRPEEMRACAAFLDRQLELIDPKVIILMGRFAIDRLLATDAPVGRLRGTPRHVSIAGHDVPAVVTYHPSYLLRNPVEKEKSWQDFVLAKRLLAGEVP